MKSAISAMQLFAVACLAGSLGNRQEKPTTIPASIPASQPSLHGRITRAGKPVANAYIIVWLGTEDCDELWTDAQGFYKLMNPRNGSRAITAYTALNSTIPKDMNAAISVGLNVALPESRELELNIDIPSGGDLRATVEFNVPPASSTEN
ncbi:MAG: hypothetical protein HY286_04530 [Planctomycetes bacterium]|nr:hypothetical protein [Planctomycetota bacterium]